MNAINNVLLSALESRGYTPKVCTEDGQTVVRCGVNVVPLTVMLTPDEQFVDCSIFFDMIAEADEEHQTTIRELLANENGPFTDVTFQIHEHERFATISTKVPVAEFTADTVNAIVDAIEKKDGIVASMKRMSRTDKSLRPEDDLAEARDILEKTIAFFTARGYEAKYYQEDLLQVDCTIDGGMFAITCEGTEYTFGIDCLYFFEESLTEEEEEEILEIFRDEYAPFENLYLFGEDLSIQSEFPYEMFSDTLLEDVITTLTRPDGYVAKIKEIAARHSQK